MENIFCSGSCPQLSVVLNKDPMHTWFLIVSWAIRSQVDSAKYKCKQPMFCNANASRCVPDKDVTEKYIINVGHGGSFGDRALDR